MPIIISNLSKKYRGGIRALQSFSLTFNSGIIGLLGPNGAGKTTLMKIIATLLKPTAGTVAVAGFDVVRNGDKVRRILGYLPQETEFLESLNGYEFLNWVGIMKNIRDKDLREQEVQEVLIASNLGEYARKKIKTYSGGTKRRLGIAQALLGNPRVVIFDEPTSGLDPEERVRFYNLLSRLKRENRVVIISTHIVSDIKECCDQVGVLRKGRLQYYGSLQGLREKAAGMLYRFQIPLREMDTSILESEKYKITGIEKEGNCFQIKALSENKIKGAILAQPTLEDGYLALMASRVLS